MSVSADNKSVSEYTPFVCMSYDGVYGTDEAFAAFYLHFRVMSDMSRYESSDHKGAEACWLCFLPS